MLDERAVRLLEEIRDLLREQGARQQEAVAGQRQAEEAYRRVLRRVVPLIAVALVLVLVVLLLLVVRLWGRMS